METEGSYTSSTNRTGSLVKFIERSQDLALIDHQVRLELKSAHPVIRATQAKQVLECLVSIKSEGQKSTTNEFIRYCSVDIICVIDVSGSMSGAKIELVKRSLTYLLSRLGKQDRLAIIKFATKATVLCGLTSIEESGRLNSIIDGLKTEDSTNIKAGMELAYNIVGENSKSNRMQCVLLLSDGMDMEGFTPEGASIQLQNHFGTNRPPFTIHSLGYGNDHDPKIMKKIAKLQGGKFRFVEKNEDLDIVVAKLLGGIFSAIAKKIVVTVRAVQQGVLVGSTIKKIYGESVVVDAHGNYTIPIVQYRAGSTNSYAIEVDIPAYNARSEKSEFNKPIVFLEASAHIEQLNPRLLPVRLQSRLEVTVLHPNEILKKTAPDAEVVEYHCRANAVEIIKICSRLMEEGKSAEAKTELQKAHELLNKAPQTEKIQEIREDITRMMQKANQRDYKGGYRFMTERDAMYGECEEGGWGESMMCTDAYHYRRNDRSRK